MAGYRINVRNCKRATVTSDTNAAYTIGTPVAMPTLRDVEIAFTTSSGTLYGDGEKVSEVSLITGATLKFGIDKLTQADKVALLGVTKDSNGIISYKTTDKPPKVAIYFEVEHDDGGFEATWLLVGKAQPIGLTAQQKEDSITYSTETVNIDFVRRELDKTVIKMADTDDADFTTVKQTAFAASPDLS